MYSETTRGISVTVKPIYLEDQSSPAEGHFVWAYHVRIENRGEETVQLRRRYWKITDGRGQVQEVRGPGVVGEQPVLGRVRALNIPAARRCRRPRASWSAPTRWRRAAASVSRSASPPSHSTARISRCA